MPGAAAPGSSEVSARTVLPSMTLRLWCSMLQSLRPERGCWRIASWTDIVRSAPDSTPTLSICSTPLSRPAGGALSSSKGADSPSRLLASASALV
eukprot:4682039-Amphidinium_carterae.3